MTQGLVLLYSYLCFDCDIPSSISPFKRLMINAVFVVIKQFCGIDVMYHSMPRYLEDTGVEENTEALSRNRHLHPCTIQLHQQQ